MPDVLSHGLSNIHPNCVERIVGSKRSWKRSVSLAALVAVTCGALQAATPNLRPVALAAVPSAAREARLPAPKIRAAVGHAKTSLSKRRTVERPDGSLRRENLRSESLSSTEPDHREEPRFEPWSLVAGLFGVIVFVASRRRAD